MGGILEFSAPVGAEVALVLDIPHHIDRLEQRPQRQV